MRFDIATIFPEFFRGPLDYGIVKRARDAGLVDVRVQDLREFTRDRHRTVDDRPFGGGEGMVLKPEPLFEAVEALLGGRGDPAGRPESSLARDRDSPLLQSGEPPGRPYGGKAAIVLLSASGKSFNQADARRLAHLERVVLLCGRYEGVDERVAEHLATDELSVGDFVLSGGELPAAMVVDAVTRLLPGALGHEDSAVNESFSGNWSATAGLGLDFGTSTDDGSALKRISGYLGLNRGILDCPHYTRPPEFRGWAVPDVLLSGNHAQIRRWRRMMALAKTARNRPDLLAAASLTDEDRRLLAEAGVHP